MIVECPNCKTTYNLADSLVPEGGRNVKCTVCDHVFRAESLSQERDAVHDADIEDLFGADSGDSGMDFGEASPAAARDDSTAEDKPSGGYEIPDDLASASTGDLSREEAPAKAGNGAGLDLGGGFSLDGAKPKKESKGGKKKVLVLAIVAGALLLLAGAAAGLYFLKPGLVPGLGKAPAAEEAAAKPAAQAQVENITLDKIRQYYVENEKIGKLFVVEGVAVNDFDAPKELIAVEVSLFDAQGQTLAGKRQMAGNSLSLYQLQILEFDKIESGLVNESGIAANNTFVQPRGEVPFMVVFANPPATVSEFVVKVVEVKDPPPKP